MIRRSGLYWFVRSVLFPMSLLDTKPTQEDVDWAEILAAQMPRAPGFDRERET